MVRFTTHLLATLLCTLPILAATMQSYGSFQSSRPVAIAPHGDGAIVGFDGMERGFFRIDRSGALTFAKSGHAQVHSLDVTPAGETVLALGDNSGSGLDSFLVVKLGAKGETVWTRRLVNASDRRITSLPTIAAARDGGAYVAASNATQAIIVKLDRAGERAWSTSVDLSGHDRFAMVRSTKDGGCIAVGAHENHPWIVKFSEKGTLQWQRTYTIPGWLGAVVQTTDGDLVAAGRAFQGLFITRMDGTGNPRWQRHVPGVFEPMSGVSVVAEESGDVIVAMSGMPASLLYLVRRDGTARWKKRFATPSQPDYLGGGHRALVPTAGGWWFSPPIRGKSIAMFRIDRRGDSDCALFTNDAPDLALAESATESLPATVGTVRIDVTPHMLPFTDLPLTAAPLRCEAPPPVAARPAPVTMAPVTIPAPPAPASVMTVAPFRGAVEEDAFSAHVTSLLRSRRFAELDALAEQLRRDRSFFDPMRWKIEPFYGALANRENVTYAEHRKTLDAWRTASPKSITACLALTRSLYDEAWEQRGGGYGDTVTTAGLDAYRARMAEAMRTLASCGKEAEADPDYWYELVKLTHEVGGEDIREIVRRAAKRHAYPTLFRAAALYLHTKWGGSPEEYFAFADEAAKLTRDASGDALYMWLVYQAAFNTEPELFEKEYKPRVDWPRVRKGSEDAIRLAPQWLPTYHRYARMAEWFNDRATARELFQKPELTWYEGAESLWRARALYENTRRWALTMPVDPAVAPATKLKEAPSPVPMVEKPFAEWPPLVMQSELVLGTATHRRQAAFLVQTPSGVVAVSSLPVRSLNPAVNALREAQEQLRKWTLWSPADPKQILTVTGFDTRNVPNYVIATALTLAPVNGALPVAVLPILPESERIDESGRAFIVGCGWRGDQCVQTVAAARMNGTGWDETRRVTTLYAILPQGFDPEWFRGGVLLHENGYAMGVITHTGPTMAGGFSITAQLLSTIITTSPVSPRSSRDTSGETAASPYPAVSRW